MLVSYWHLLWHVLREIQHGGNPAACWAASSLVNEFGGRVKVKTFTPKCVERFLFNFGGLGVEVCSLKAAIGSFLFSWRADRREKASLISVIFRFVNYLKIQFELFGGVSSLQMKMVIFHHQKWRKHGEWSNSGVDHGFIMAKVYITSLTIGFMIYLYRSLYWLVVLEYFLFSISYMG